MAVLGGALLTGPASVAESEAEKVLRQAGATVTALEAQLAVVVAREEYLQTLSGGDGMDTPSRRELASDVVWVPTGDPLVWAFFRDVLEVDGRPIPDRTARLQQLFSGGPTPEAREQGARILEESARYNIGLRRTLNNPTVALSFLHPRNQQRFRFEAARHETVEGVPALKVGLSERRPGLIRTQTGLAIPARGAVWVGLEGGILVRSELNLDVPNLGPGQIRVLYRPQARLRAWLPAEMRETYGERGRPGHLEAVATYSDYRRAEVEVQEIVPVR